MTMTLIETKTLASATTAIEFTSIPSTFTDLSLKILLRSDQNVFFTDNNNFTVNGTTSGYSVVALFNGANAFTASGASAKFSLLQGAQTTGNTFTAVDMYIPNYAGSTNKTFAWESATATNTTTDDFYIMMFAGLLTNTAPISSIRFNSGAGNFSVGSTISLYGITKGSSGGVVVS
jgi:hypothetical protein